MVPASLLGRLLQRGRRKFGLRGTPTPRPQQSLQELTEGEGDMFENAVRNVREQKKQQSGDEQTGGDGIDLKSLVEGQGSMLQNLVKNVDELKTKTGVKQSTEAPVRPRQRTPNLGGVASNLQSKLSRFRGFRGGF